SSRPRHGKQLLQRYGLAWRENNSRGGVLDIHLPHQLATSATRSASHTFVGHRHDAINLGFARLEHLCDRRVLGTKPEAARRVNADAAVEGAAPGYQRCRNSASRAVLAGSKLANEFGCHRDEFLVGHGGEIVASVFMEFSEFAKFFGSGSV